MQIHASRPRENVRISFSRWLAHIKYAPIPRLQNVHTVQYILTTLHSNHSQQEHSSIIY